jgi:hypothetical protein
MESQSSWYLKTLGLVILAAVVTALLTTFLQQVIWGKSNPGVAGGASAGVAVAIAMSRRRPQSSEPRNPPKP